MSDLRPALDRIVGLAREGFPEFDVLRPNGVLRLDVDRTVDRIRIELRALAILELQSVGLSTAEELTPEQLAGHATVTASSWREGTEQAFSAARLLDFDHPSGPAFQSVQQQRPWLEIAFDVPVRLDHLRLRALDARTANRLRDLQVSVGSPDAELEIIHDAGTLQKQLLQSLQEAAASSRRRDREVLARLAPIISLTVAGRYFGAKNELRSIKKLVPAPERRAFAESISQHILFDRSLEWTSHGPVRSFRFWPHEEQVAYIESTVEVADALSELTPNVSFGYGAALAVVRDRALIPHDDDLDLIIAFEPHEAATLGEAHTRVEEFLRARGFEVTGDFFGHRHVARPGAKKVDVFSGLFEGDKISWHPGVRRGLDRDTVFPAGRGELLGVACPLPARPEQYLETIYGPGWVRSDPGFTHSWRKRDFADQA